MQEKKGKKLSTSLIAYLFIVLFVLNVITAIFTGIITNNAMSKKENDYLSSKLAHAKGQISSYMDKYISMAEWIARDTIIRDAISSTSYEVPFYMNSNFNSIIDKIKVAMDLNKEILNFGIGVISEDTVYKQDGTPLGNGYSLRKTSNYSAINQNRTILTEPYIDSVTGKMCVSISSPIYNINHQPIGLIILDLDFQGFSDMLASLSFDETGRLMLFSQDEIVIAYEDKSKLASTLSNIGINGKEFDEQLVKSTEELFNYNIGNENRIGIISEIEEYNWRILIGISKKEFYNDAVMIINILSLLTLVTLVITLVLLYFKIVKKLSPISYINSGLMEMSKGNLKVDILYQNDDEIGEMANSMRLCVKTISTYISEIDRIMNAFSSGDLTVRSDIDFKGDFCSIKIAIEGFINKLVYLLSNITDSADQVFNSSEQVSNGSQALAQGATEQASSIEELAATINEISEQIKNTAENAQTTKIQTEAVSTALNTCNIQMHEMVETMEKINESSAQISGIIKTIEDIAFQTNILALNAAVEAARAGTAGKGFAVVADEVRNLASKTANASKMTSELIETSLGAVEKGTKVVNETSESLIEVINDTKEAAGLVNQISNATEEQSNAISQINLGVEQISNVVQTTSSTAEASASASRELSKQSDTLHKLVEQFILEKSSNNFYNSNIINSSESLYDISNDNFEEQKY